MMSYIFNYASLQPALQSDDVIATDPTTCVKLKAFVLLTSQRQRYGTNKYVRPPTQENRIEKV